MNNLPLNLQNTKSHKTNIISIIIFSEIYSHPLTFPHPVREGIRWCFRVLVAEINLFILDSFVIIVLWLTLSQPQKLSYNFLLHGLIIPDETPPLAGEIRACPVKRGI